MPHVICSVVVPSLGWLSIAVYILDPNKPKKQSLKNKKHQMFDRLYHHMPMDASMFEYNTQLPQNYTF